MYECMYVYGQVGIGIQVSIKLHISTQSGMILCIYVFMYTYQIAHNRAIRPFHLSHSILLALILPRGVCMYVCMYVCG